MLEIEIFSTNSLIFQNFLMKFARLLPNYSSLFPAQLVCFSYFIMKRVGLQFFSDTMYTVNEKKETVLFSSQFVEMLANLNDNFTQKDKLYLHA